MYIVQFKSLLIVPQHLLFAEYKKTEQDLLDALAMFHSQMGHMNPEWYAKVHDKGEHLFKFMRDNICDENCCTLPKTVIGMEILRLVAKQSPWRLKDFTTKVATAVMFTTWLPQTVLCSRLNKCFLKVTE